ncbi:hypothetical protein D3C81_1942540 [compost metagenome]
MSALRGTRSSSEISSPGKELSSAKIIGITDNNSINRYIPRQSSVYPLIVTFIKPVAISGATVELRP